MSLTCSFCDLGLPKMHGLEVLKKLRRQGFDSTCAHFDGRRQR
jgi:CheY-like chemotaxis protein